MSDPSTPHRDATLLAWVLAALVILVPLALWGNLRDYTLAPKFLILQIALVLLLVSWSIPSRTTLRLSSPTLPAVCYVLASILSLFQTTDPVAGLLEGSKLLSGFLLFLIVANRLKKAHLPVVLVAITSTGLLISLLGIAQYLGWQPFQLPSAGLPSATLGFRNIAAMYLIQTIPFGLALLALARSTQHAWFASLATGLMAIFLIYTRTRGAWLGLTTGLLLTTVLLFAARSKTGSLPFQNKGPQIGVVLTLIFALTLIPLGVEKLGPQSMDEKKLDIADTLSSIVREGGDRGRLTMWRHTLEMVQDHPLFGVGLGNWAVHYPQYDGGDRITFEAAPERPHNDLLSVLSETGLVGLVCYLWFLLVLFKTAQSHLKTSDPLIRWIASACLIGLTAIFVHSLFSFPRERITPTLFFWLSAGFLARFEPAKEVRCIQWIPLGLLLLSFLQLGLTLQLIRFESYMKQAVRAEAQNNWDQVAVQTRRALDAGAFHPEAIHLHGYALNALGRFAESRSHYELAHRRRPYDIQILNGLAIAAQNLGDFPVAQTHYRQALQLIPRLPDVSYNLAGLYLQMGQPTQAVAQYETVLVQEPPTLDLYYRLGVAYFLSGQTNKADETYRKAFQAFPNSGVAHFEHIERALRTYRRVDLVRHAYQTFLGNWKGPSRDLQTARKRLSQFPP